jgi:hypothetical protein
MFAKRHTSRPRPFRAVAPEPAHDESFPRAVAGEDYDRYARAMARRADEWLVAHLERLHGVAIDADELRSRLRAAATTELRRELYPQEERLLSEVLQRRPDAGSASERVQPEIPSFLLTKRAS